MIAAALVLAAVALCLSMAGAWLLQRRTGKSGWIDAVWSVATASVGALLCLLPLNTPGGPSSRAWLVALMLLVWGLRLGSHIAARTLHGGEDPRYADLAAQWGDSFPRRLFFFLQIQALCSFVLVASAFIASRNPAPFPGLLDLFGVIVFVASITGETVADRQLQAFRNNRANKGGVCDVGLWGMSRHPNYFFETLIWVAYVLIAINAPSAYPWGYLTIAAPVLMYWLLAHVSGIPPLEASMAKSRGAAFANYQARVNAFFPGPAQPSRTPLRSDPT